MKTKREGRHEASSPHARRFHHRKGGNLRAGGQKIPWQNHRKKKGRKNVVQLECTAAVSCFGLSAARRVRSTSPTRGLNSTPLQCRPWEVEFLFLALFCSFMDCIYRWLPGPLLRGLSSSCGEWGGVGVLSLWLWLPAPAGPFSWCRAQALGCLGSAGCTSRPRHVGSSWRRDWSSGPPAFTQADYLPWRHWKAHRAKLGKTGLPGQASEADFLNEQKQV